MTEWICSACDPSGSGGRRPHVPVAGRLISPGWHEVGRFLGPSIRAFHAAYPEPALLALWRDAGIADVRSRRLSLGGGVVMWGRRDG